MNKILIGHKARGSYYESLGKPEEAVKSYLKCRELPDVLRSLALAYSDLDDLENSIMTFEEAVQSGDMKSVPWLVTLLQIHRPVGRLLLFSRLGLFRLQCHLYWL